MSEELRTVNPAEAEESFEALYEQFINNEKLSKYEDEIEFDKKVFDELINYGISNLKRAKEKHDVIEGLYIPSMYFDEIDKLKDTIIDRIMKYDTK